MENKKFENRNDTTVESICTKSADGKWFINKTIITDIKPMTYMEKVFSSKPRQPILTEERVE